MKLVGAALVTSALGLVGAREARAEDFELEGLGVAAESKAVTSARRRANVGSVAVRGSVAAGRVAVDVGAIVAAGISAAGLMDGACSQGAPLVRAEGAERAADVRQLRGPFGLVER
jgi:hypothetical protein